ncbi:hypothetical protein DFS33DRAFT_1401005, partial [Desarmillaria ectypa]
ALVFGASGICGWAIVNKILENYPERGTFDKVTAITQRPLDLAATFWPVSEATPKARMLPSSYRKMPINSNYDAGLQGALVRKIPDIDTVTHIFYCAYAFSPDPIEETKNNGAMAEKAMKALNKLAPHLAFVAVPTRTKASIMFAYGNAMEKMSYDPPLRESYPRIPGLKGKLFYYDVVDKIAEASDGKSWSWCEVRLDLVLGFVPNNNVYNFGHDLAVYLSLYARFEGKGSRVHYPGTMGNWTALSNDASQDRIARMMIWGSLNSSKTYGRAFNVADQAKPMSMSERWPFLCEYFGLVGLAPDVEHPRSIADYMKKHAHQREELGLVVKDPMSFGIVDLWMDWSNFDRYSVERAREAGFTEETDQKTAWYTVFDRFKRASLIF